MAQFEIRWSDDRFDRMKPEDRLEAVSTLIEYGTLDFGDGSMSDVHVREVPADATAQFNAACAEPADRAAHLLVVTQAKSNP